MDRTSGSVFSPVLGTDIDYLRYRRDPRTGGSRRVLLFLYGRGASMESLRDAVPVLDELPDPPAVVMPDAPWGSRAGWYVDSEYTGQRAAPAWRRSCGCSAVTTTGIPGGRRRRAELAWLAVPDEQRRESG